MCGYLYGVGVWVSQRCNLLLNLFAELARSQSMRGLQTERQGAWKEAWHLIDRYV